MADTKITALTALTAADPANDVIPIVDVSDTSMAASGTTKKISVNNILGASGTATLASATITGAATVGTTLGVTGDLTCSSNVNAGASPTFYGGKIATNGSIAITAGNYLKLWDSTGNGLASINASAVDTFTFSFTNAFTTALTLNSTANLVLKGGTVAANGVGITFPATQVASSDANCLDDYEEGTWVGTLTGSTTNPTVPVTATGKYTKIGRQVTVVIYFSNVSTVGASGAVGVTGLPFTEDGGRAVGTVAFYNFDFNGGTGPFVDVSGATMFFQSQLTNSNWRDVNHSAGLARYLRATVTYFV